MLAAIRRICASLSEHGSRPAPSAATTAGQSTNAITVPSLMLSPVSMNSPTKSPRSNQPTWPISSLTAASAQYRPRAPARSPAATSSKYVVSRGVLRRN